MPLPYRIALIIAAHVADIWRMRRKENCRIRHNLSLVMNDTQVTCPPIPIITQAQQQAGELAYLRATKYKSATADYPSVVRAILEAGELARQA
jgi:hypothetical protein